ncbi:uncharacterized protein EI90DRAFT_2965318 [Cantharellus anzutake]|uniref:uncharacterized protein n=1 Tax=Cantharellus anzutake TaxID=1750568 RepID=UPI0019039C6D|nr:uncharacterized protein EI90DRAFT_2965318 [Cantharellus anzutake]KAF8342221.1 hypothetical protein EI90DRAFT_2965318 [Cantharellus anzutake]
MSTSAGVISFLIQPGKNFVLEAEADINIKQVSLHEDLVDNSRSSLKIFYSAPDENDGSEDGESSKSVGEEEVNSAVIANFIPGVIEHQPVRLVIPEGQKVSFEITGKNSVYLSGNIILQLPVDLPSDDEDDFGSEIDAMDDEERDAFLADLIRDDKQRTKEPKNASSDAVLKTKNKRPAEDAGPSGVDEARKKIKTADGAPKIVATPAKKGETLKGSPSKEDKLTPADTPAKKSKAGKSQKESGKDTPVKKDSGVPKETPSQKAGGKDTPVKKDGKVPKETPSQKASVKDTPVKKDGTVPKETPSQKGGVKDTPVKKDGSGPKETPSQKEAKKTTEAGETEPVKAGGDKSARTVTKGGVKVEDKLVGSGPAAKPGKTLSMRYILRSKAGKIWDQNVKGKPFKFKLGAGEVIKGWDEGLTGMHVGGERKLEVPPEMGYGNRKTGDIPSNSTLYFEVKLLDVSP